MDFNNGYRNNFNQLLKSRITLSLRATFTLNLLYSTFSYERAVDKNQRLDYRVSFLRSYQIVSCIKCTGMIDHHAVEWARDSATMQYRRGRRWYSVAKHAAWWCCLRSKSAHRAKPKRKHPFFSVRATAWSQRGSPPSIGKAYREPAGTVSR